MKMKKIIIITLALYSNFAMAYLVGGIACESANSLQLKGYWKDYDLIWNQYHSLTEDEVIDLVDSRNSLRSVRYPSFRKFIESIRSDVEHRPDMKLRLSENDFKSCEGVFYREWNQPGWISSAALDQLLPFERVTIYLEYILSGEQMNRSKSRTHRALAAGFFLTDGAKTLDPNEWLAQYNDYLEASDDLLFIGRYFFVSTSVEFKDGEIHGTLSDNWNFQVVNSTGRSLRSAKVILKDDSMKEAVFDVPLTMDMEGGKFKTNHFTLSRLQEIKCAVVTEMAFLRNQKNEVEVLPPGSRACFQDGFVSRFATEEDFQLLK